MELTILMPCLNESETLAVCIRKAKSFLEENHIDGEILISDNGSADNSREIAAAEGVRVVITPERGYGSALINGTKEAYGRYVIMGDADDSYDFLHLMPFLEKLREGYDLVMGNRFAGGIEKGAMPFLHRYIGNPILSFLGRILFNSKIHDFHCGLRGYNREAFLRLNLQTTGMEYASEMVVAAELSHLKIAEVPTTLKRDGRSGKPHLRSFRDGWRHLKFLLMYAPNWLFMYPGIIFLIIGTVYGFSLLIHAVTIHEVTFSVHTMLYCSCMVIIGLHVLSMYKIAKVYAYNHLGTLRDEINWNERIIENRIILWGAILTLLGLVLSIVAVMKWKSAGFGTLEPERIMRLVIPAVTFLEIGIQNISAGFLVGMMKIRSVSERELQDDSRT